MRLTGAKRRWRQTCAPASPGQTRADLAALASIQAYTAYYKRFNKTYHVLLQLESVAFKGRSIPRVAALVEAMFMAELNNQLLTAGHDLDVLRLPVTVGIAAGNEQYTMLNGREQALANGDMFMGRRARGHLRRLARPRPAARPSGQPQPACSSPSTRRQASARQQCGGTWKTFATTCWSSRRMRRSRCCMCSLGDE